jgi:hypothetical protein
MGEVASLWTLAHTEVKMRLRIPRMIPLTRNPERLNTPRVGYSSAHSWFVRGYGATLYKVGFSEGTAPHIVGLSGGMAQLCTK